MLPALGQAALPGAPDAQSRSEGAGRPMAGVQSPRHLGREFPASWRLDPTSEQAENSSKLERSHPLGLSGAAPRPQIGSRCWKLGWIEGYVRRGQLIR